MNQVWGKFYPLYAFAYFIYAWKTKVPQLDVLFARALFPVKYRLTQNKKLIPSELETSPPSPANSHFFKG